MFRFSCFHPHIHSHKPKKPGQPSAETLYKALQDLSVSKESSQSTTLNQLLVNTVNDNEGINGANHMDSIIENGRSVHQICGLKKSQSLGSMPYGAHSAPVDNDTEDGIDRGFSCDSPQHRREILDYWKDCGMSTPDQFKDADAMALKSYCRSSNPAITESIVSMDESPHREKIGGGNFGDPGKLTSHATQTIVKSCSMPHIHISSPLSGESSPNKILLPQSRSSEHLPLLNSGHEMSFHEVEMQVNTSQLRDDTMLETEKHNCETLLDDGDDAYPAVVENSIIPNVDEVNGTENLQGELAVKHFVEEPSNVFRIKRIEEWVSDLQPCSPLEETTEVYQSDDEVEKDSNAVASSSAGRIDTKVIASTEAAKRYISSMNAASTTAQLANHGLVVVPLLSAFVSLKVLNLSANAIGRITAGSLPRGLHMLNLSKNNIATIEGLRELTRLRVLDLSYNRIFRIGHGLASCSSLKELYLAGNKISEVEGLHRLLKLSILDLRFNKISTTKSLGQLAANYNSLQAISLEGNPAQKNVGDSELRKQMQTLLPLLAYYNHQPTKGSGHKDGADRSVRLGISGHQFDHGVRADHRGTRKTAHGLTAQRASSSSTHSHKSQAVVSPRRSKLRASALPPTGNKVIGNARHHHFDISSKAFESRSDTLIRRSRSEGTLADL